MKTIIYTAEVTYIVPDGIFNAIDKEGVEKAAVLTIKERLDADDAVITKVQMFETPDDEE